MPLLHIIGLSPSNASFSIAFCFMQNEQEESYKWTLQTFFSWLDPLPFAPVLCTDRDLALLGVIKAVYPRSPHLLYVWYINKNVLIKTK
jgi:histone-lysine N-methyltransferase SETD2